MPTLPFVSISDSSRSVMSDDTIDMVEQAHEPSIKHACKAAVNALLANVRLDHIDVVIDEKKRHRREKVHTSASVHQYCTGRPIKHGVEHTVTIAVLTVIAGEGGVQSRTGGADVGGRRQCRGQSTGASHQGTTDRTHHHDVIDVLLTHWRVLAGSSLPRVCARVS